jgi:hypothetical protein
MISEVSNALLLTYFATEYLLVTNNSPNHGKADTSLLLSRRNIVTVLVVALVNVLDRMSGLALFANELLQGFLHVPRILFAAAAYVMALYVDCRRVAVSLSILSFLRAVGTAFFYILPVYPFMAVLISFVFLFVIRLFELLHLPVSSETNKQQTTCHGRTCVSFFAQPRYSVFLLVQLEWLNAPIYYGCIYGPFSFVYFRVKQRIVLDRTSLPAFSKIQTVFDKQIAPTAGSYGRRRDAKVECSEIL